MATKRHRKTKRRTRKRTRKRGGTQQNSTYPNKWLPDNYLFKQRPNKNKGELFTPEKIASHLLQQAKLQKNQSIQNLNSCIKIITSCRDEIKKNNLFSHCQYLACSKAFTYLALLLCKKLPDISFVLASAVKIYNTHLRYGMCVVTAQLDADKDHTNGLVKFYEHNENLRKKMETLVTFDEAEQAILSDYDNGMASCTDTMTKDTKEIQFKPYHTVRKTECENNLLDSIRAKIDEAQKILDDEARLIKELRNAGMNTQEVETNQTMIAEREQAKEDLTYYRQIYDLVENFY